MGNGRSHTLTFLLIFSFLFVLQPSLAQGKDVTQISKEEILADYCEVLRADGRENMSESVNKLFSIARSMVVESREIKGVTQTWAIGVRSLRNSLLRATDEELKGDKSKISTLASEFEPSLTDSVCEWARMLGQDDPGKANSYARWEVVGNINKIGESVESEFYRELLAQLKELAGTKIPDMTEEEAAEEIADTLEEVKVCKEGCQFAELEEDWVWVKGRARNVSGNDLIIAEVKGFFYDGQDNLVTTMPATTVGLGDGELWDFEISVYVDPKRIDRVVIKEGDCSSGNF